LRSVKLQAIVRELKMSVVGMLLREPTSIEIRRVFAELAQDRPDAIMVHGSAEFTAYHIVRNTVPHVDSSLISQKDRQVQPNVFVD
jgi:hypothetical protein